MWFIDFLFGEEKAAAKAQEEAHTVLMMEPRLGEEKAVAKAQEESHTILMIEPHTELHAKLHAMPHSNSEHAPGTQIPYRPDLIPQFKQDHQHLLRIFAMIGKAFSNNDLASTSILLKEFHSGILGHLLDEKVHFYIYLEHALKHKNQEHFNLMHCFREEMDMIGRSVLVFFAKYQNIDKQPCLAPLFAQDLESVGTTLVERIQREEETLYPLYLPAY